MHIKDLSTKGPLAGVKFIFPKDGEAYYFVSMWAKGVWGRRKKDDIRVIPLFIEDPKEVLEWEVVQDD